MKMCLFNPPLCYAAVKKLWAVLPLQQILLNNTEHCSQGGAATKHSESLHESEQSCNAHTDSMAQHAAKKSELHLNDNSCQTLGIPDRKYC